MIAPVNKVRVDLHRQQNRLLIAFYGPHQELCNIMSHPAFNVLEQRGVGFQEIYNRPIENGEEAVLTFEVNCSDELRTVLEELENDGMSFRESVDDIVKEAEKQLSAANKPYSDQQLRILQNAIKSEVGNLLNLFKVTEEVQYNRCKINSFVPGDRYLQLNVYLPISDKEKRDMVVDSANKILMKRQISNMNFQGENTPDNKKSAHTLRISMKFDDETPLYNTYAQFLDTMKTINRELRRNRSGGIIDYGGRDF